MEQVSAPVETTQILLAKKVLTLENQLKGGINWFYLIAGLSIVNSIIFFSGGSITFVIGLGATQFVDGFVSAIVKDVIPEAGTIFRVVGFGLDFLFAGIFAAAGILGQKRIRWAVIAGMVFYSFDGLLTLAFGDWFSTLFHGIALFGLWKGQKAIAELKLLERSQSTDDLTALKKLLGEKPSVDTAAYQKNVKRISLIILIPLILLVTILVVLVFALK